jgi:hypothetical protein
MQHLNDCLAKCDDSQYKNMKRISFRLLRSRTTQPSIRSAINFTPFEAGHGLRGKTVTEARANPRLQIIACRRGRGYTGARHNVGEIYFPPSLSNGQKACVCMTLNATPSGTVQAHECAQSQPVRRKIQDKGLQPGDRVYFYRPPSQHKFIRRGRKAKHLAHYHGPTGDTRQGRRTRQTAPSHP